MATMDPNLFPWMSAPPVQGLEGTLGAGAIPQQPAQAPVGATPSQGFWGSLGSLLGARQAGAASTVAPEFGSAGGAGLYPFTSQSQNVPYFPPPPVPAGGSKTPEMTTQTSGPIAKEPGGGGQDNKLADALRGVKAPPPPEAQTVRTPPPPQTVPIRGGEFVAMLSSLGITPQEFMRMRGIGK